MATRARSRNTVSGIYITPLSDRAWTHCIPIGTTAAAATAGASRSLSRPKKASKSRERKTAPTSTSDAVTDTTAGTTTDATTETTPAIGAEQPEAGEAAAGTAVAGAAVPRTGSVTEEDKNKKSRSQSRGKRQSLFGNLLGKKEEHDAKKEVKKEEKEEKKEEKEEKKLEKESDPLSTGQTPGFDAHAVGRLSIHSDLYMSNII